MFLTIFLGSFKIVVLWCRVVCLMLAVGLVQHFSELCPRCVQLSARDVHLSTVTSQWLCWSSTATGSAWYQPCPAGRRDLDPPGRTGLPQGTAERAGHRWGGGRHSAESAIHDSAGGPRLWSGRDPSAGAAPRGSVSEAESGDHAGYETIIVIAVVTISRVYYTRCPNNQHAVVHRMAIGFLA